MLVMATAMATIAAAAMATAMATIAAAAMARTALAQRGIDLSQRATLRLANAFGHRAVEQRLQWLEKARAHGKTRSILKGTRVVVTTDGGRIRERQERRGRRRDSGYHSFDTPWREPKLLVIYVIDSHGNVDKTFRPIYDGTLDDCDAIFDMIAGYLSALGAHEAKELILVGDGAKWIWDRVDELVKNVGIDAKKVKQVIDWYHAVETLHKIAGVPAKWANAANNKAVKKVKDKWVNKAKDLLYAGDIDSLEVHIRTLAVGRKAKEMRKHIQYFTKNRVRMQYQEFEDNNIPRGSGAVESTVRRVINLRMKGNGKFWNEQNAQSMLLLRSYLKAGRFEDLVNWSIATAVDWWAAEHGERQYLHAPIIAA